MYTRLLWQGNVRAVVHQDNSGTTVLDQTTYYYPYGMPMAESTSPDANRYKYTAKELFTDSRLNLADHGARMYDPAIGRWLSADSLQEKIPDLSPYTFCNNNPIFYYDPNGNFSFKIETSVFMNFGFFGFKSDNITASIAPIGGAKCELSLYLNIDTDNHEYGIGLKHETTEYQYSVDASAGIIGISNSEEKSTTLEGNTYGEDSLEIDTSFHEENSVYLNSEDAKISVSSDGFKVEVGKALELGIGGGGTLKIDVKK